jgi:hypothetical protein
VLSALVQVLVRVKKPYMITRKGLGGTSGLALRTLRPYIAMVLLPLAACWLSLSVYLPSSSQGYLLFAMQDAVVFLLVLIFVISQEIRGGPGDSASLVNRLGRQTRPLLAILLLGLATVGTAVAVAQPIWDALSQARLPF